MLKRKRKDEITAMDVEVLERQRNHVGKSLMILNIICFAMSCYQIYFAGIGGLTAHIARAIHLGFGMVIVFLIYPISKKSNYNRLPWYDILFALMATVPNLYLAIYYKEIADRAGNVTTMDFVMGAMLIILLLEAARRVVGPALTGVAVFFILYSIFGAYLPEAVAHRGVSVMQLVRHMYLTTEGVFGIALGVSCNFIFLFILMGAILTHMGTGEFLIQIALCGFGRQRGGPAKAAVVGSALFGMINGSAVANIATIGTFTIPLMKKVGYKPHFAGSVEASASIGGQIMPPVMGAAAFIMAEFLGVPYLTVCLAAAVPAMLYFTSIFFAVHQEAMKLGIKGLPKEEIPRMRDVIKKVYLALPILIIVIILVLGYSPAMAGIWAIISAILLSWIRPESRLTPKKLFLAFADGAKGAIQVLIACAIVGFVIGSFTTSGMGLRLASLVVLLGGGKLLLTLILVALASLILGMGVPTTPNYVMISMITVPALILMDVEPMAAHLFCFYYGIISDLTPPVALASLAGSGIAGARFWPTAINSTKLGCAAYLAPFFFVFNPELLLGVGEFTPAFFRMLPTAMFGIMLFSCGLYGFVITKMGWIERIVLFAAAFACLDPGLLTDAFGIAAFIAIYFYQRYKKKKTEERELGNSELSNDSGN